MTDPTPLSPTAQTVWTAFNEAPICAEVKLAAALRVAADQVVPEERKECECFTNEAIRLNRMGVRAEFLAIADELETSTTENR